MTFYVSYQLLADYCESQPQSLIYQNLSCTLQIIVQNDNAAIPTGGILKVLKGARHLLGGRQGLAPKLLGGCPA